MRAALILCLAFCAAAPALAQQDPREAAKQYTPGGDVQGIFDVEKAVVGMTPKQMVDEARKLMRQAKAEKEDVNKRPLYVRALAYIDQSMKAGGPMPDILPQVAQAKYLSDMNRGFLGSLVQDYFRDKPGRRRPAELALASWFDASAAKSNEGNFYAPFRVELNEAWQRVTAGPDATVPPGQTMIAHAACMTVKKHKIPKTVIERYTAGESCQ